VRILDRICSEANVSTIHHVTFSSEFLPPCLPKKKSGINHIWGPVGASGNTLMYFLTSYNPGLFFAASRQALRQFLSKFLMRFYLKRVDLLVFQTGNDKRFYKKVLDSKGEKLNILIRPNVVVPNEMSKSIEMAKKRSNNFVNIICIGGLEKRKRVDLVLRILELDTSNRIRLTVVGQGEQADSLKAHSDSKNLSERITWTGSLPREETLKRMKSSDVLVHMSMREGVGWVVAEAGVLGIPVVCLTGTGSAGVLEFTNQVGIALDLVDKNWFRPTLNIKNLAESGFKAIMDLSDLQFNTHVKFSQKDLDDSLIEFYNSSFN
jgi:glycosyltransferase involved in cell wall biosynthesis